MPLQLDTCELGKENATVKRCTLEKCCNLLCKGLCLRCATMDKAKTEKKDEKKEVPEADKKFEVDHEHFKTKVPNYCDTIQEELKDVNANQLFGILDKIEIKTEQMSAWQPWSGSPFSNKEQLRQVCQWRFWNAITMSHPICVEV